MKLDCEYLNKKYSDILIRSRHQLDIFHYPEARFIPTRSRYIKNKILRARRTK